MLFNDALSIKAKHEWKGRSWWDKNRQGKPILMEIRPMPFFTSQIPPRADLGSNPGLNGRRRLTARASTTPPVVHGAGGRINSFLNGCYRWRKCQFLVCLTFLHPYLQLYHFINLHTHLSFVDISILLTLHRHLCRYFLKHLGIPEVLAYK